jgi:hypothetical protein
MAPRDEAVSSVEEKRTTVGTTPATDDAPQREEGDESAAESPIKESQKPMSPITVDGEQFDALTWLADAPLFIGASKVDALSDATWRPDWVEVSRGELESEEVEDVVTTEGNVSAKVFFPGLFKFGASGGASLASRDSFGSQHSSMYEPLRSPHRDLVHLAFHYLKNHRDRVRVLQFGGSQKSKKDWDADLGRLPKVLAFIDFAPNTIFLPIAAELASGRVVLFFNDLIPVLAKMGATHRTLPIDYPEEPPNLPDDKKKELKKRRREYWRWFESNFEAGAAMNVVERLVGENGPVRWIDYRIPLDSEGTTLHAHLQADGRYDTGTFAYNLIKRGWKHGLRFVGALKAEPDMNVLAIMEK